MMGERTVAQEQLFYEFSLERHVPEDHLLRSIDRFVDLSELREELRPFSSEVGRPSTNYLIDVEHGVIVDVEATTAVRQAEVKFG